MHCIKKQLATAILLLLVATIAGCTIQTGAGSGTSDESRKPRELPKDCEIGFLMTLGHPYWENMRLGSIDEGEKFGVEVTVMNAKEDPALQVQQIQEMIAKKVDAVCLVPMKKDSLITGVQALNAAGIPVVIVNREVGEGCHYYCYVGTDTYGGAVVSAKILMEAIGGEGKIIEFHQHLGTGPQLERTRALDDVCKEYPNVEIIARLPHKGDRSLVISQMQTLLDQHPDLKGVYAHGDMFSLAAMQACRDKNRGEVAIVGMGGSRDAIEAIERGHMTGTSFQRPEMEGRLGVRMAIQAIKRRPPGFPIECPAIVEKNADQFEGQF